MRKHTKLYLCISIIVFIICISLNAYFSIPYYKTESVHFQNVDGNQIGARYSESKNGYGVIIANDFTHDKSELVSIVNMLVQNGYGVFVFDFPSEGESEGYVNFHYKDSSFMAEQFYNAMVVYSQLASLPAEKIHIVGYGEGARAALETVGYNYFSPNTLTLIGCSLNLSEKTDFDIINYVNDRKLEWVSNLKRSISCNVHIVYSDMDEISNKADNEALAKLILKTTTSELKNVPHCFLMRSTSAADAAVDFITKADGTDYNKNELLAFKMPATAVMYIALMFSLYLLNILMNMKTKYDTAQIKILPLMPKSFIKKKLHVHIFALPMGIFTAAALYLLSLKMPYMEIIFYIYIAYPILMTILYSFTDFCNEINLFKHEDKGSLCIPTAVFIGFLIIVSAISYSGTYSIFSYNSKIIWRLIFTVAFGLMFYVDNRERNSVAFTLKENLLVLSVNCALFLILPFLFLFAGFYTNAVISGIRLVLLGIVILFGGILNKLNCPTFLSSLYEGFLYQMIAFANMMIFTK